MGGRADGAARRARRRRGTARARPAMIGRRISRAIVRHGVEVAVGRDREPRLDDVDAEAIELARQAQLLARGHAEAGRLLAVAQRRVEDAYARRVAHGRLVSGSATYIKQIDKSF